MAKCSKCGAELADNAKFCASCGAGAVEEKIEKAAENVGQTLTALNDTPDTTGEYSQDDIAANKTMAILAYIIVLIPLFAAKESKYARFHTNQGLVLTIALVIYSVVNTILSTIFYSISFGFGAIMGTILGLVYLLISVLAIIGIINAANGKAKELPLIGKIKILK